MFSCLSSLYKFLPSLNLNADRPDMSGVPDLGMVECCYSHENATSQRDVILTSGIEAARDFECPMTRSPAGGATDIGAIPGEITGDNHARNNDAWRYAAIEFAGVRQRFHFGHEPARAIALADVRIERNLSHRDAGRREIPGQPPRYHNLVAFISDRGVWRHDEIFGIVGGARIRRKPPAVGNDITHLHWSWIERRPEMLVLHPPGGTATGCLPLPNVRIKSRCRCVMQTPAGHRGGRFGQRSRTRMKRVITSQVHVHGREQDREFILVEVVLVAAFISVVEHVPAVQLLD